MSNHELMYRFDELPTSKKAKRSRTQYYRAAGLPCPYCGRIMGFIGNPKLWPTKDHLVPKSRGGVAKILVCNSCNISKKDLRLHEWLERLKRGNDSRVPILEKFLDDINERRVFITGCLSEKYPLGFKRISDEKRDEAKEVSRQNGKSVSVYERIHPLDQWREGAFL